MRRARQAARGAAGTEAYSRRAEEHTISACSFARCPHSYPQTSRRAPVTERWVSSSRIHTTNTYTCACTAVPHAAVCAWVAGHRANALLFTYRNGECAQWNLPVLDGRPTGGRRSVRQTAPCCSQSVSIGPVKQGWKPRPRRRVKPSHRQQELAHRTRRSWASKARRVARASMLEASMLERSQVDAGPRPLSPALE